MNVRNVLRTVLSAYNAVAAFVKAYPGGTAGAATAVIALAATFGLHVTVNELAAIVSAVSIVAGILVHLTTVPKPAKPAHPKMGGAQSNFHSTAVTPSVNAAVVQAGNSSHDIGQGTDMGQSSSAPGGNGSSDQEDSSWSSGNSSTGAHSMTIAGTGGSNGSGEMATWNTGAQSAGTAHTHPMDHYHDVSHDHDMDHYHNTSHNHTIMHGHYYGAQQVTDFNEVRDTLSTLITAFNALVTDHINVVYNQLTPNVQDYEDLVQRVNSVITQGNQTRAKLWDCLDA